MASIAQAPASPSHNSQSGAASPGPQATSSTSPTTSSSSGSGGAVRRMNSVKDTITIVPPSASCSYAPCFCEENVWKICEKVRRTNPGELSKCYAVFVSNQKQVVPLWRQKAGKDEEKLVIWDYHVIFLYIMPDERCLVYDLDSDLPFPTYFHKYVTETFRTDAILNAEYHRFFRVVSASVFLQKFASDRRHMKKADGTWMKSPPNYPCIQTADCKHNLDDFISMDERVGVGEVMSLKEFVKKFFRN